MPALSMPRSGAASTRIALPGVVQPAGCAVHRDKALRKCLQDTCCQKR